MQNREWQLLPGDVWITKDAQDIVIASITREGERSIVACHGPAGNITRLFSYELDIEVLKEEAEGILKDMGWQIVPLSK